MKKWLIGILAALFLSSCGVDKSADRMADSTEALNKSTNRMADNTETLTKYVELLEKHVANMDKAFLILLEEFKTLNGNVEVLKEISPLIDKFDEFLEESEDDTPIIDEDEFDFGDVESPSLELTPFQKIKNIETKIKTLDPNIPEEKKALLKINKTLEDTVKSIETSLEEIKQ